MSITPAGADRAPGHHDIDRMWGWMMPGRSSVGIVPGLLLCLLLALTVAGCSEPRPATQAPRVAFLGMVPTEFGLLEQTFQVRLRVENPNGFPLILRGVDYELFVNGKQFLTGVAPIPAEIPALESVIIQLPGRGSILEWINSQESWDGKAIRYRIIGSAHLDGGPGRVAFEREGEISLDRFTGTLI